MGWVYRKADEHVCPRPSLTGNVHGGDIWQCSGPGGCGAFHVVRDDQRDGLYYEKVEDERARALLVRRGVLPPGPGEVG